MQVPSKREYKEALETIKKYEGRQEELAKLNRDLGSCLRIHFNESKFDVDKQKGEVIFTGVTKDGKLKLSKAVCSNEDIFEEVIGKLIAVKKSVGENFKYVEKYIKPVIRDMRITADIGTSFPSGKSELVLNSPVYSGKF